MSPHEVCRAARSAVGREGTARSVLLCAAVLACSVPAFGATARDPVRVDRDLPCNDLCRAWMAWRPGQRTGDDPAASRTETTDDAARSGLALAATPPRLPRLPVSARAIRDGVPGRPETREARRLSPDREAPALRRGPSWRGSVSPRRPSALVSTPIQAMGAGPAAGSRTPGLPMAGVDPSDAAVLAQPLYRPSSIAGAPRSRPETSDDASGSPEEARAPDPVTARAEERRDPGVMTRPAVIDRAARPAPSGATLPPAGQPRPPSAAADPPPAVSRPAAEGPVAARSPHRSASAGASPAPALPASDLERLDEAGLHERPAAPTVSAPPTAAALLLGGLAALSIVGRGRRRPAGHASEGRRA